MPNSGLAMIFRELIGRDQHESSQADAELFRIGWQIDGNDVRPERNLAAPRNGSREQRSSFQMRFAPEMPERPKACLAGGLPMGLKCGVTIHVANRDGSILGEAASTARTITSFHVGEIMEELCSKVPLSKNDQVLAALVEDLQGSKLRTLQFHRLVDRTASKSV